MAGAGAVGTRRARGLAAEGAHVVLVDPHPVGCRARAGRGASRRPGGAGRARGHRGRRGRRVARRRRHGERRRGRRGGPLVRGAPHLVRPRRDRDRAHRGDDPARRPRRRRGLRRRPRPSAVGSRARRPGPAAVHRAGRPAAAARARWAGGARRRRAGGPGPASPSPGWRRSPPPTSWWPTGWARPGCSTGCTATSRSCTSARRPRATPCPRPRSTGCSSSGPGGARPWCGSRVATRSSTGAGARRCTPAARPVSTSRWCPASARHSRCPVLAGIPLTQRGVVVVGARVVGARRRRPAALAALAAGATLVLLMAVASLGEICAAAVGAGVDPDLPVAVVENGSLERAAGHPRDPVHGGPRRRHGWGCGRRPSWWSGPWPPQGFIDDPACATEAGDG